AINGSHTLWSVWRNAHTGGLAAQHEHADPFAEKLATSLNFKRWAAGHDLRTDAADTQPSDQAMTTATAPALEVGIHRIRTSVEVRRTRAVGGHLPSAARSNTVGVLFTNYLRGDTTAREWAEEVVGDAVADAARRELAEHLELAIANIQRLTLDNHHLRQQLHAATKITHINTRSRG
ncbi:MAG: hypothetical protein LC808_20035, partial [Actinobacteria bacterium]|nr:hypothetical protein [Actinomycetota bacterium]